MKGPFGNVRTDIIKKKKTTHTIPAHRFSCKSFSSLCEERKKEPEVKYLNVYHTHKTRKTRDDCVIAGDIEVSYTKKLSN